MRDDVWIRAPAREFSALRFARRVGTWRFIQTFVLIAIGVSVKQAVAVPYLHTAWRDLQRIGHFLQRQQPGFP